LLILTRGSTENNLEGEREREREKEGEREREKAGDKEEPPNSRSIVNYGQN